MNIVPMKDKVLVAETKKDSVTSTGIIIEGRDGNTASGKVLAIGPDVTDVKVGDTIYLDWSKTSLVKVDGAQRVIVKQEDIFAVLED